MSHSQGPWRRAGAIIWGKEIQREVARVANTKGEPEQDNANAKLIRTAPCLLEALEEIVNEINASGCLHYMNEASEYADTFNEIFKKAQKAIKRARGE